MGFLVVPVGSRLDRVSCPRLMAGDVSLSTKGMSMNLKGLNQCWPDVDANFCKLVMRFFSLHGHKLNVVRRCHLVCSSFRYDQFRKIPNLGSSSICRQFKSLLVARSVSHGPLTVPAPTSSHNSFHWSNMSNHGLLDFAHHKLVLWCRAVQFADLNKVWEGVSRQRLIIQTILDKTAS